MWNSKLQDKTVVTVTNIDDVVLGHKENEIREELEETRKVNEQRRQHVIPCIMANGRIARDESIGQKVSRKK